MTGVEQSLTSAYLSEENGIVERANQDVLRYLNAILVDSQVVRTTAYGAADNEHSRGNLYGGNPRSTYFKQLNPVI